jgi:uncharacterized protein YprB with RNaseH-like and TPR domain
VSALTDRLRALAAQAGAVAPVRTPAGRVDSPTSAQLRTLLAGRERRSRASLAPPAGRAIAPGVYGCEQRSGWPAAPTVHLPWGDEGEVARERLVWFDTETTGLAGGVGTRAFMIGAARWQDGVLQLRQLYLTALAGEPAMLAAFADWLPPAAILISYNGRSYDAPLLKGRFRLNRLACPLEGRGHCDLLYPTRRRYRGRWENCRLATIERQALGVVREDDLPGAEAPAAWLSYLRGVSARPLGRVLDHNAQDLRSLVLLLDHLSALPAAD